MTLDELAADLAELGQPAYRASQIASWVYQRGVGNFDQMTDLSASLRQTLSQRLALRAGTVARSVTTDDGVLKLLIQWPDEQTVETVLIPAEGRATACVSTQVGCPIGCTFCASGAGGFVRNLTCGEILEQILHLQEQARCKVTHVVFMGTGEPLANYDATLAAVRAITDEKRLGISARRVTISTVGLAKGIRRLAREDLPVTLAISLHAPNEALRRQIIPHAPNSLDEVIVAAQEFFASRKREVTLEYILLAGVNDTNVCAAALAHVAHKLRCNVNLIPYNPVEQAVYERPSQEAIEAFQHRLAGLGVNVQLRRPRGLGADAACGQLRQRDVTQG